MKIYILQEYDITMRMGSHAFNVEWDKMVWSDLNALHAFLASMFDAEYPLDIRRDCSNAWDVYTPDGKQYRIIETQLNPMLTRSN